MKALPTIPPSYSAKRSGEIIVYHESVSYGLSYYLTLLHLCGWHEVRSRSGG